MGDTIDVCGQLVRENHQITTMLNSSCSFGSIITTLARTKNLENGVICSVKADIKNGMFPSSRDAGISIIALIKAAPIIRRIKNKKPEKIGQKIKIRLMFKDEHFKEKEIRDKLQSLSQDLTEEIVVRKKIVCGSSWPGRFYFGKREQVRQFEKVVDWNMERKVTKQMTEYEYYVNYDAKDRGFPSLSDAQEEEQNQSSQVQRQNEVKQEEKDADRLTSKLMIGITGFEGMYSVQTGQYFGKSLYALMELPKDELIKYFRFEVSPGMNRLKCWWWAYFYYYDCKADRQLLGKFFKQAMKIGGGVRSYRE